MPGGDGGRKPDGKLPWYSEGVRFECQPDCGKCCTRHGDYDYVYLEGEDLSRLAGHLGLSHAEFRSRLTQREDGHTFLRMDGPECPFLQGKRCGVYEARPSQCSTFPFWPDNLRDLGAWEALADFCPGIGNGPIQPMAAIERQLDPHRGDG